MAVVDRGPSGALRGDNVLALHPGLAFLGLLAPMPIFFAAGGWASAGGPSTSRDVVRRISPVVLVAAIVCGAWGTASIVSILATGGANTVSRGARIATQPLWFLAAYVPFVATYRVFARAATHIRVIIPAAVAFVVLGDWLQYARTFPRQIGFPGFFVVWGTPWLIGTWWHRRSEDPAFDERRTGAALTLIGLVACVLLVRFVGYSPSLIDAVPGRRTNSTPPGLFTMAAAVAQVGVLMMVARMLDSVANRHRNLVKRFSSVAVGIYAWHLTGFALCAAMIALGLPAPERFSTTWWLTRPLWFVAIITVTFAFADPTRRLVARIGTKGATNAGPTSIAVLLATTGTALTGLYGPRSIPMSLVIVSVTILAVRFLRPQSR